MKQVLERDVFEPRQVSGVYEPFWLKDKVSDDELLSMLRRQQRIYRQASNWECWDAILRGELQSVRLGRHRPFFNKVTRAYLDDTEGARMVNAHTSDKTGILYYLAVGTGNTEPADDDTQLLRETFRATPLEKANTSSGPKFILKLGFADGNITTATTIAAGSWSTTVFEVDSATGFAVGDAIQVGTPTLSETRITAIDGNQITVNGLEPLSSIPLEGQAVRLMIGEAGAFGNETADTDPDTGDLFSRAQLRIIKSEDIAWFIRFNYLRTAV